MANLIFNPFTNKLDFVDQTIVPPGTVATLTGDTGGPIAPVVGTINIQGDQPGNLGAISFDGSGPGQIFATVLVDNNTISINSTTGELTAVDSFVEQIGDFTADPNTSYFCTGTLTVTLPDTALLVDGSFVTIIGITGPASYTTLQTNVGQAFRFGSATSAINGTATNTLDGNAVKLRFRVSTGTWIAESFIGNWILT